MTGPKKVQIREAHNGQWYVVAVGGNNEDGPVSETYPDADTAEEMAQTWWPGVPVERVGGSE